jgi:hypothetical protein
MSTTSRTTAPCGADDAAGIGMPITIGKGLHRRPPGSPGTHLVVTDIEAARAELHGRGVEVSDIST